MPEAKVFCCSVQGSSYQEVVQQVEDVLRSWGLVPGQYRIEPGPLSPLEGNLGPPASRKAVVYTAIVDAYADPANFPPSPPPLPTNAALMVSRFPDRSGPVPLNGSTVRVTEDIYVFLVAPNATRVDFFLDGAAFHAETAAPWDFNGGSDATANPYKVALSVGLHSITTTAMFPDGSTIQTAASIAVAPKAGG